MVRCARDVRSMHVLRVVALSTSGHGRALLARQQSHCSCAQASTATSSSNGSFSEILLFDNTFFVLFCFVCIVVFGLLYSIKIEVRFFFSFDDDVPRICVAFVFR